MADETKIPQDQAEDYQPDLLTLEDEDAQLVILRVGTDAEGEYLDVVDDDETLMEVGALFEQRLSDSFDIG